jgi:hypothetical protein
LQSLEVTDLSDQDSTDICEVKKILTGYYIVVKFEDDTAFFLTIDTDIKLRGVDLSNLSLK